MEITDLLTIATWVFAVLTAFAVATVFSALIGSGRHARADRERNRAYDEASS